MNGEAVIVTLPARLLSLYGTLEGSALALASNPSNTQLVKLVRETAQEIDRVWTNKAEPK